MNHGTQLAVLACVTITTCTFAIDVDPNTRELLNIFCVDCHGSPNGRPKRGYAIGDYLAQRPIEIAGPLFKKALDAIEAHEMPPEDPPTDDERNQLIDGLRRWLQQAERPGKPVLRRLTRLEYSNTVRDLLGLDTDVFMFPERLPFDKSYFQPASDKMPVTLRMRAREYGGKYPVLLPGAGLPGDNRAEHGFTNRGDAQNTSAVRLETYVTLAQQIMRHPDLLTRARRLQEIFPETRYQEPAITSNRGRQLVEAARDLAPNNNVAKEAVGNAFTLSDFRERLAIAFDEDRGGVYDVSRTRGSTIPGKGGLLQLAYGDNASRMIELNPSEDIWNVPFATAIESSGDSLFTNKVKGKKKFLFGIGTVEGKSGGNVSALGVVVLGRRGQSGTVRVAAELNGGQTLSSSVAMTEGIGKDNTFVSFKAPKGRSIKRLHIDGTEFSGDYVLLDDLAFITSDPPAGKQALVGVEPARRERMPREQVNPDRPKLNLSIAKQAPRDRLAYFMRRAFRRPVTADEVSLYLGLYQASIARGAGPEDALRETIAGVLASPRFLYVNPGHIRTGTGPRPLTDHELASRLSYFLWNSMPDDELMSIADQGRLSQPDVLESQTRRMLKDRGIRELSENFYVEWLKLRELWSAQPDRHKYSSFYAGPKGKATLADDMFGEALLLFETILIEDRPILELLNADYTWINAALARRLYKLGELQEMDLVGVDRKIGPLTEEALKSNSAWYRVKLTNPDRGGVMTMGATLTLTSFPTRTSPIKRGVWLLETIFNRPPPLPQFAVADIDEQEFAEELTVREKTQIHRSKKACAICHDRIDPPGFALEGFDAIGRFRTSDGGRPIDDTGTVPGAGDFNSPGEFKQQLLKDHKRFVRGFVEKLLSYALNRELEYHDDAIIERIVEAACEDQFRLSRIIVEIVRSDAFRIIEH